MKRIVFTIYDDLPIGERVTEYSKSQFRKYKDRLWKNKSDYANLCEADFRVYGRNGGYRSLQHFKIKAMETLAEDYDEVLYMDFDVVAMTEDNIFKSLDLDKFGVLIEDASSVLHKEAVRTLRESSIVNMDDYQELCAREHSNRYNRDDYHRIKKAYYKKEMLFEDRIINQKDTIANTGILIGNKKSISELKYTHNLNYMKSIASFDNNEVFLTYLIEKNDIQINNLEDWHRVYDDLDMDIENAKMLHVINKRFEDVYG